MHDAHATRFEIALNETPGEQADAGTSPHRVHDQVVPARQVEIARRSGPVQADPAEP